MDLFIKMDYLSKEMLAPYAPVLKLSNTEWIVCQMLSLGKAPNFWLFSV